MSSLKELQQQYAQLQTLNLDLNMERGQPASENFDLCTPLLTAVDKDTIVTDAGVDIRNYPGGIHGLIEAAKCSSLLNINCPRLELSAEAMADKTESDERVSFVNWTRW